MPPKAPLYDDAHVHLDVLGHACDVDARVRIGECKPVDVLPLAQAIANKVAEVGEAAAVAQGKSVSCRAGCSACCRHQIVPVAPIEAVALAKLVSAMPPKRRMELRRRFASAVRRLEDLGLLGKSAPKGRASLQASATDGEGRWAEVRARYFEAAIPCPFLEDEKCSIYAERPVVCREYLAVTPADMCKSLDVRVETTPRPLWMSEVLSEVSAAIADAPLKGMPLVLALEWAEVHGALLEKVVDGEDLFHRLMDSITQQIDGERPDGG